MKLEGSYLELAELLNGLTELMDRLEQRRGNLSNRYYERRLKFLQELKDQIEQQMKGMNKEHASYD